MPTLVQRALDFETPHFGGATYSRTHDGERLTGQFASVFDLMSDGQWRTLAEIASVAGGSEAGVSARIRDCRKEQFGGHTVERRRRGEPANGLYEYRLVVNQAEGQA